MINPGFIWLGVALSVIGATGYIRATISGRAMPNRVTWGLWGFEGVIGFLVEIGQGVGPGSLITLMFGVIPLAVVVASFFSRSGVWKIEMLDIACMVGALAGVAAWGLVNSGTLALVCLVGANTLAGVPTLVKAWKVPESESSLAARYGVGYCLIALGVLTRFTSAGVLFPGSVLLFDLLMVVVLDIIKRPRANR